MKAEWGYSLFEHLTKDAVSTPELKGCSRFQGRVGGGTGLLVPCSLLYVGATWEVPLSLKEALLYNLQFPYCLK